MLDVILQLSRPLLCGQGVFSAISSKWYHLISSNDGIKPNQVWNPVRLYCLCHLEWSCSKIDLVLLPNQLPSPQASQLCLTSRKHWIWRTCRLCHWSSSDVSGVLGELPVNLTLNLTHVDKTHTIDGSRGDSNKTLHSIQLLGNF